MASMRFPIAAFEIVEAAYDVAFAGDEEAIVAHLFTLYATLAA